MRIRQPIVSVLGHVDHGKTSLLDKIRGTCVVSRECGAITQHIGATEVPLEVILERCTEFSLPSKIKISGLLFIDTPGHKAFTTLRKRGGALSDLAVLVIDINDGPLPQTYESIRILKMYKTPFVIALNKIDTIPGWAKLEDSSFMRCMKKQSERILEELDSRIYNLAEKMYRENFSIERYDRIEDFTRNVAVVPTSAKHSVGIPDLLMVLIGLSQKFLEKELTIEEGPGKGTVLEVKEDKGLGKTIDVIIYSGTIRRGDTIVVGTLSEPIVARVRALLKPRACDEIRSPEYRFESVKEVSAAAGVKISASSLDDVVAGAPLYVSDGDIEKVIKEIKREMEININLDDDGVILKGDAVGSLEALASEFSEMNINIKRAEVGDISKRDIIEAATNQNPLNRVVIGFNVKVLSDAESELQSVQCNIILGNVIYRIVEDFEKWRKVRKDEIDKERRLEIVHPGMFKILSEHIFRISKPAIVGIRVLGGRVRTGQRLLKEDGRVVGRIKSIRSGEESLKEAIAGQEVAIAVESVTVGRQIKADEVLYVDVPECDARKLRELDLTYEEKEILEKVCKIKEKEKPFWGR